MSMLKIAEQESEWHVITEKQSAQCGQIKHEATRNIIHETIRD